MIREDSHETDGQRVSYALHVCTRRSCTHDGHIGCIDRFHDENARDPSICVFMVSVYPLCLYELACTRAPSSHPCTSNFACVRKCVYPRPVLRFRFASSVLLALFLFLLLFFFFHPRACHVGATIERTGGGHPRNPPLRFA